MVNLISIYFSILYFLILSLLFKAFSIPSLQEALFFQDQRRLLKDTMMKDFVDILNMRLEMEKAYAKSLRKVQQICIEKVEKYKNIENESYHFLSHFLIWLEILLDLFILWSGLMVIPSRLGLVVWLNILIFCQKWSRLWSILLKLYLLIPTRRFFFLTYFLFVFYFSIISFINFLKLHLYFKYKLIDDRQKKASNFHTKNSVTKQNSPVTYNIAKPFSLPLEPEELSWLL